MKEPWREVRERPSQLVSIWWGGLACTRTLSQSTWSTCGWTMCGKQTTRRRTHTSRWRACKLHTERIKADMWTLDTFRWLRLFALLGQSYSVSLRLVQPAFQSLPLLFFRWSVPSISRSRRWSQFCCHQTLQVTGITTVANVPKGIKINFTNDSMITLIHIRDA